MSVAYQIGVVAASIVVVVLLLPWIAVGCQRALHWYERYGDGVIKRYGR